MVFGESVLQPFEQPGLSVADESERAPHAARRTAQHQHPPPRVAVALAVIDVSDRAFGQVWTIVRPLAHVEQSLYGLEIVRVVRLEVERIGNVLVLESVVRGKMPVENVE